MNIPIYCVCDSLACVLIHAVNKVMSKQTDSCVHVYASPQTFVINYNINTVADLEEMCSTLSQT